MRLSPGLLAGLAVLLLVASFTGCSGEKAVADTEKLDALGEQEARAALLTLADLGPGYRAQEPDADDANEGIDCLSRAARDFDAAKGATDLELEYTKQDPAGGVGQVSVLSGVASFEQPGRAESTLDQLRAAMQDCGTAEYEQDDATVRFDISVSDGKTDEALDQQVNVALDGEITAGETVLPLVIELRYFRIANHGGTVSVSMLDSPSAATEVGRLVEIGVDRFVDVAGSADATD